MREPWVRILAWSELLAGAAGALLLAWTFVVSPFALPDWYIVFVVAFFSANIVAGYLLLGARSAGVTLSFVLQALQVLVLNFGVAYVARAGIHLTAVVASTGAGVFAGPSATFIAYPTGTGGFQDFLGFSLNIGWWLKPMRQAHWAVGVNLAALYFAIRLWRSSLWAPQAKAEPRPTMYFKWGVPVFAAVLFIVTAWLAFGGSDKGPNPRWALPNGDTVEILVYNNEYAAAYRLPEKTVEARHYLWVQFRSDLTDRGKDHLDAVAIAHVVCPHADSLEIHHVMVQPSRKKFFGLVTYSSTYWFDAGPARCDEASGDS